MDYINTFLRNDYMLIFTLTCSGMGVYIAVVHKIKLWYKRLIFSFICGPLSFSICCWFMLWDWLVEPKANRSSLSVYYETQDGMPVDVALLTVYRMAWRKGFLLAVSILLVLFSAAVSLFVFKFVN